MNVGARTGRRRGIRRAVLAAALLFAARRSPAQSGPPSDATSRDALERSVRNVLREAGIPGAAIALVDKEREIWSGGIGLADLESGRRATGETLFRLGSNTKGFVALAVLKLAEQGRLDLDARVAQIAPEISVVNPWEKDHPVTVAHVLEHTAGFEDVHFNEMYCEGGDRAPSLIEVLSLNPASRRVRWPPGTRMAYSNPGYTVAGYLVEKASGRRFEDYVREEILLPLGMRRATFVACPEIRPSLARGYSGHPARPVADRSICLRPSGGLLASASEMGLYVRLLLNRGAVGSRSVLRPESIRRMEETRTLPYVPLDNGYGLGNYGCVDLPLRSRGHGGRMEGFHSRYRYFPELGRGYVVLLNRSYAAAPLEKIERLLLAYLTRGAVPPAPSRRALPERTLRGLTGVYRFASPRRESLAFWDRLVKTTRITLDGGVLYRERLFKPREPLVPAGGVTFRASSESGSSVLFAAGAGGEKILLAGGNYYERTPAWLSEARTGLFLAGLLVIGTCPLTAVVFLIRRRRRAGSGAGPFSLEGLPLLALLCAAGAVLVASETPSESLGTINPYTIGFCALSAAFAIFSIAALLRAALELRRRGDPGMTLHALFVSLTECGFMGYLAHFHLIGARLWIL